MSEVTINIPAEHVEAIRALVRNELCAAAEAIGSHWDRDTARLRDGGWPKFAAMS